MVLNRGSLVWESSALNSRSLLHIHYCKSLYGAISCKYMRHSCLLIMIYFSICHKTSLILSSFFLVLLHSGYPKHFSYGAWLLKRIFKKRGLSFWEVFQNKEEGIFRGKIAHVYVKLQQENTVVSKNQLI